MKMDILWSSTHMHLHLYTAPASPVDGSQH